MKKYARLAALFCLAVLTNQRLSAQPELEPWGNLAGIRTDGQLFGLATCLRVIDGDGHELVTAKERQDPHYSRTDKGWVVRTNLDSIYFTEMMADGGMGTAFISVDYRAHADMRLRKIYFTIDLPKGFAEHGINEWMDTVTHRKVDFRWVPPPTDSVWLEQEIASDKHIRINVPMRTGSVTSIDGKLMVFTITTSGPIDRRRANVHLNATTEGRPFDGVGGNFRIQNTRLDPMVIDYCLKNIRVAWGRVELPWRWWQPVKDSDPLDSARAGHLNPAVQRAMEMAHTLGAKKIPFVLSAWFPPDWAVVGPVSMRQPGPGHIWGNPLNHENDIAIYRSIADYIAFLKEHDSVEPKYFSFNESDLGINVRQTAQEHDALIKGLGAYLASRGVRTRVLLGDNSDATTWPFIGVAMQDTAARRWMGAVSFHSWRGWGTATLEHWADAATRLRLPLLVAEGSIDAAAWHYPDIFKEPSYALKEIGLYTRLLALCQPESILQWQLTSDYSLLAGGGIFGDMDELHPSQRFYNLKQLSMTPPGLFAMRVSCDRPNITVAALGDNKRRLYTLHLVNDGATRDVVLTGLPADVKTLEIYTTNQMVSVKEGEPVHVLNGQARFTLAARSFVTLISR
ncbi:MAG TPA: hypothetical protein VGQ51_02700 [Puia sp.]|jgi:hypothetical protein|nr:hypothetical protein [Puia sp.]